MYIKNKYFVLPFLLSIGCVQYAWPQEVNNIPGETFIDIQEGLPEHLLYMESEMYRGQPDDFKVDQNIAAKRLWDSGQTIKVCFFGGDEVVRKLVATIGAEWGQHTNLKFDFGDSKKNKFYNCSAPSTGFSQIRVGFSERGYWSTVGTDSYTRATQLQPSMNLEGFNIEFSAGNGLTVDNVVLKASESKKGTIRHEFGHAIGLLHEHQNRNFDCWSEIIKKGKNSVYKVFGGYPNYWGKEKVERNLSNFLRFDPDARGGKPDPNSIMMYLIPERVLTDGIKNKCYISKRNNQISNLDSEWVKNFYHDPAVLAFNDFDIEEVLIPSLMTTNSESQIDRTDLIRIYTDLESKETSVRRTARATLAKVLEGADGALADEIILELPNATYYKKLGVAFSLSEVNPKNPLSLESKNTLNSIAAVTVDPTLKNYLDKSVASNF